MKKRTKEQTAAKIAKFQATMANKKLAAQRLAEEEAHRLRVVASRTLKQSFPLDIIPARTTLNKPRVAAPRPVRSEREWALELIEFGLLLLKKGEAE